MVKSTFRKVLGKSRLNYEELFTIITEVQGIINMRPLTYFITTMILQQLLQVILLLDEIY